RRIKLLDPNAPKRPANAFILYCELQRECIKEERRLIHNKEEGSEADTALANLTKALGFRWRSLKDEDRQVYQEMFRDQVKQYDTDIAEY
ncbi:high mobility group box domain-containing protein, partial [Globomyces pollinis-pini]